MPALPRPLLQYGGAKYIPTGRGYAIKHNTFVKVGSWYGSVNEHRARGLVEGAAEPERQLAGATLSGRQVAY